MKKSLDIVGIGTPDMDILYTPIGILKRPGGYSPNTIIRLQRFGLKTGVIGRVGNDEYGREILEEFEREKVDISRLRIDRTYPTTKFHIKVSPKDREPISSEHTKSLKRISKPDEDYLKFTNSIYLSANSYLFDIFSSIAKKYSKKLFVTLHMFGGDSTRNELLRESKIEAIFGTEREVEKIENILGKLIDKKTKVAITKGRKGCSVYTNEGSKEYPSFEVDCIDPTGAGDAFSAGFIYGYLNGWDLDKTCNFANAMGALAITEYGARGKLATKEEVFEFLRKQNIEF